MILDHLLSFVSHLNVFVGYLARALCYADNELVTIKLSVCEFVNGSEEIVERSLFEFKE